MNFQIVSVTRFISGVVLLIVLPIMIAIFFLHKNISEKQTTLEKACVTKIIAMPQVVEITAAPTATPSPTIKPKFVPVGTQSGVVK